MSCFIIYFGLLPSTILLDMATGTQTQTKVRIIGNPSNWEEPLPANHGRWFSNFSHVNLALCRLGIKKIVCSSPSLEIYLIFSQILSVIYLYPIVMRRNAVIVFKMR